MELNNQLKVFITCQINALQKWVVNFCGPGGVLARFLACFFYKGN
jgi:hypothetical protein